MAGGQERILRRRIKSIEATKKITRAMELIAASRIVKAQARVAAAKPYSEKVTSVISHLAAGGAGLDHPLLRRPEEVSTVAYVVVAADRGLCGGYNTNVLRSVERAIAADRQAGRDYRLLLSGKKARSYFAFRDFDIHADFQGYSDQPAYEDARRLARVATDLYEKGEVQEVRLAYTRFISMGVQEVEVAQFMPLETPETAHEEGEVPALYEFEPNPTVILEHLLPRYADARLFAAMLEASASEHAARQRAMKAATDNAEELKTTLSRIMNRARQDAITTEIMEIVGGSEALSHDQHDLVSDDLLADTIEGHLVELF